MSIHTDINNIQIKTDKIDKNYEMNLFDNEGNEIYIKTPKLYYREQNKDKMLFELSLNCEEFFSEIKSLENRIKYLVKEYSDMKFNEESLSELYNSFIKLPPRLKMCPLIEMDKTEFYIYDKDNNTYSKELKNGDAVVCIMQIDKVKFYKNRWRIVISPMAIKMLDTTEQLSEYMFKDSDEDTNVIIDSDCFD